MKVPCTDCPKDLGGCHGSMLRMQRAGKGYSSQPGSSSAVTYAMMQWVSISRQNPVEVIISDVS